jgi:hypothetical protein
MIHPSPQVSEIFFNQNRNFKRDLGQETVGQIKGVGSMN